MLKNHRSLIMALVLCRSTHRRFLTQNFLSGQFLLDIVPKKKKTEFDGRILPTILDFNVQLDSQLTSKANFLFSASTLILLFVLNKALSSGFDAIAGAAKAAWSILLAGAFLSSLTSLMIVLPRLRIF